MKQNETIFNSIMEKKERFRNHEVWRLCNKCGGWFDLRMGVCDHCNYNSVDELGGLAGLFISQMV